MRFVILLIAMSMIAWMAAAVVPEVPQPKAKALTGVAHPKAKAVEPVTEADATPDAVVTSDSIAPVEPTVLTSDSIVPVEPVVAAAAPALVPSKQYPFALQFNL